MAGRREFHFAHHFRQRRRFCAIATRRPPSCRKPALDQLGAGCAQLRRQQPIRGGRCTAALQMAENRVQAADGFGGNTHVVSKPKVMSVLLTPLSIVLGK